MIFLQFLSGSLLISSGVISLDRRNLIGYNLTMIKSFIHKGLEDFFYDDGTLKGIQAKHASKLEAILDRLDAANEIKDMKFPGSGLHPLLPKTKGRWAIKISGNWRLTFEFKDGDAINVTVEDYH
jgi:proteic killer suppression protein